MNRLIFNEGGQPVFLDDLKLLQDNDTGFNHRLLEAITGSRQAFLLEQIEGKPVSVDQEKMTTTFDIAGGAIVVDGEFLDFPQTRITVNSWHDPLYICIKETPLEEREHQDGQVRACMLSRQAYLSADKTGAKVAYEAMTLPTLKKLVCQFVGINRNEPIWQSIPVTFFNGYSGAVQFQKRGDSTRVKVRIESQKGEWNQSGLLFEMDPVIGAFLDRRWSGIFGTGGDDSAKPCALEFADRKCFLKTVGSMVGSSMELDSPSLCPVSLIFEILE